MIRRAYSVSITVNGHHIKTVLDSFEYFTADNLIVNEKKYRLVWLIERDELFIGVVNAYRRR